MPPVRAEKLSWEDILSSTSLSYIWHSALMTLLSSVWLDSVFFPFTLRDETEIPQRPPNRIRTPLWTVTVLLAQRQPHLTPTVWSLTVYNTSPRTFTSLSARIFKFSRFSEAGDEKLAEFWTTKWRRAPIIDTMINVRRLWIEEASNQSKRQDAIKKI